MSIKRGRATSVFFILLYLFFVNGWFRINVERNNKKSRHVITYFKKN